MGLDPRARIELERRGPQMVRKMLADHAAGIGDQHFVRLGIPDSPDPTPSDLEIWLLETEKKWEADALSARRHEEKVTEERKSTHWGKAVFWVGLGAALAVIVFGILDHLPKRG